MLVARHSLPDCRFINRIAKHPTLCTDNDFIDFVELDGELPKSNTSSALSGAGFVRLWNRVGDSIGKMTYTMVETDEVKFALVYCTTLEADVCDMQ